MTKSFSKINIIQILLLIVVVLLAINIIVEKYLIDENTPAEKIISSLDINKRFLNALYNYNLDLSFILKQNPPSGHNDSLKYFYNVNIPADLPISLLIREIENQFDTNEAVISAIDIKSDASVEMNIASGKVIKLKAKLNSNKEIKRQSDSIAFLITGIEDLNTKNLNELLMMPEHFGCILIPSKQAQEISKLLNDNQKQIVILLNDDIKELDFRLNSSYSDDRIRNSLKSINEKFVDAAFFIVDANSDIYKSHYYEAIKNWFDKKGLIAENTLNKLIFSSTEDIFTLLKSKRNKYKLFEMSAEDFMEMPDALASLRKIGYKFVNPSELIKPRI